MNDQQTGRRLDRRGFLGSTAAIGSSILMSYPAVHGASKEGEDPINVALIGCGTQGQNLLKSCVKIPAIQVTALCDIWTSFNLKRTSKILTSQHHEHRTYHDYKQLLDGEKKLDAVIVATPDFCHAEHSIASLKAGLHVYCEKPMSNTGEDARRMVEAAGRSGKLLQIGHQRRSNPCYLHCFNNLLGELNLLGRITVANGQWNRSVQPNRGWPRRYPIDPAALEKYGFESMEHFRNWRWYRNLGSGPMGEFGSDQIDIFNWSLNRHPTTVMASAGTDYYDRKTHEWDDTMLAIYEYETDKGPARAFYQTTSTNSSHGHFERILGDEGSLELSESGRAGVYREPATDDWGKWVRLEYLLEAGQKGGSTSSPAAQSVTETVPRAAYKLPVKLEEPPHKPHLDNFFAAIRGQATLTCPATTAHAALVSVLGACESAGTGVRRAFTAEDFKV